MWPLPTLPSPWTLSSRSHSTQLTLLPKDTLSTLVLSRIVASKWHWIYMRMYQGQRLHNILCRRYCWIMHHMLLQGKYLAFLVRARDRQRPRHLLHLLIHQVGGYCPWFVDCPCWAWFCDGNYKKSIKSSSVPPTTLFFFLLFTGSFWNFMDTSYD